MNYLSNFLLSIDFFICEISLTNLILLSFHFFLFFYFVSCKFHFVNMYIIIIDAVFLLIDCIGIKRILFCILILIYKRKEIFFISM